MKAETLRDLISGKHPPIDALWLSNPSLLKRSTQSTRDAYPAHKGGHRGQAGPGRCNYL